MKFFLITILFSLGVYAQDPANYLNIFDTKIYSLKAKGIKDFTVDLESTRLTKQLNDQQNFGKIDELIFRLYWTADPERISIEVLGLPEGFVQVKEGLKLEIAQFLEYLIPIGILKKFNGYKISQGTKPKEFIAQDTTGIAPVPNYILKFDEQDKLVEVVGNKPVGLIEIKQNLEKTSFSDGKWVLVEQVSTSSENGVSVSVTKEFEHDKVQGIGVLSEINITTVFTSQVKDSKSVKLSDSIKLKNYKINEGSALRYFLGESKANESQKKSN
jgi:hypothetical protein